MSAQARFVPALHAILALSIVLSLAACSGGSSQPSGTGETTPTLVQDFQPGSNGSGLQGQYYTFNLPNPTLANNTLICGFSYSGTSATVTWSDNNSNSWTQLVKTTDPTSGYTIGVWGVAAAAGTQTITITLSAAEYNWSIHCSEFAYASMTVDKSFTGTNITGPTIATNAQTTTVNGDIIWQYVVDGNGLSFVTEATSIAVGSGFSLLAPNRELATAAQYQVQSTAGSITPTMTINQASTHDAFDTVAVALESSSSGTLPSAGARILMEGVVVPPTTGASSAPEQIPCSGTGLTLVFGGSTDASSFDLYSGKTDGTTSWSDSEGNTYNAAVVSGQTELPQIVYAVNATCNNPNTRTVTMAFIDNGSPDPVHWYVVTGAATTGTLDTSLGSAACIGATGCIAGCSGGICYAAGDQTSQAASSTVCTNSANYNTGIKVTPSTSKGIIFDAGYTGIGPTCGSAGSTSGVINDAVWFQTENDSCCSDLDSASTYDHGFYTSASQVILQDNWANSASPEPSSYSNIAIAIKSQ